MAEEAKKLTPEEELLKNAGAATAADAGDDKDGADERTPEQKLIEDLKSKLSHAEKNAETAIEERDAERREKDEARNQAKTASQRQVQSQKDAIRSALTAAKNGFETAQKKWDDAYDAGDKNKLREAQIELNDAQGMLRGAEYQSDQFAAWEKKTGGVVSTEGSRFTPKEQAWIDKNPKFNTDRKFRAATYAAHEEAVQKGIVIDSQEYFDNLEDYLKDLGLKGEVEKKEDPEKRDEKKDETEKKTETKKSGKQASSDAVPPGGASGSSSGGGKKLTFTMTPEHREAAAICYPELHRKSPKEAEEKYAARQLEIQQKRARGEQV